MNEHSTNETETIEPGHVMEALRDIGEKSTVRDLAIALGTTDLLSLSKLCKQMQKDRELHVEFNTEDVRVYWINDDLEPEAESAFTPEEVADKRTRSEIILDAIDARHCTLSQIKNYLGVHRSVDISAEMDDLESSHVIERDYNGDVTAFFRQGQIPAKWWITGDGTIGLEEIETDADAPHPFADRIGTVETPPRNAVDLGAPANRSRLKDITEQDVEDAFAVAGNVERAAETLGMSESTLYAKLNTQPSLKAASKRGKAMFHDQNPDKRPAKPQVETTKETKTMETTKTTNTTGTGHSLEITAEKVRAAAAKHGSDRKAIGIELGYTGEHTSIAVGNMLKRRPEMVEHYEQGLADHKAANPEPVPSKPFANPKRPAIQLTPELVEAAAAEHGTKLKTAAALGFNTKNGSAGLRERLMNNFDLNAAYERGIQMFEDRKVGKTIETSTDTTPSPCDELSTPRPLATENAEPEAPISPRSETEAGGGESKDPTPSPESEKPAETESEARPENLDCITIGEPPLLTPELTAGQYSVEPSKIQMEIDETALRLKNGFREAVNILHSTESCQIDRTHITFRDGSQLLVAFEGNLFDLSEEDMGVVNHISGLMRSYNDGSRILLQRETPEPEYITLGQRIKNAAKALFA